MTLPSRILRVVQLPGIVIVSIAKFNHRSGPDPVGATASRFRQTVFHPAFLFSMGGSRRSGELVETPD